MNKHALITSDLILSLPTGATPEEWALVTSRPWLLADIMSVVSDRSVPIAERSSLTDIDGKIPSAINGRGEAHGLKGWTQRLTSHEEIEQWQQDSRLSFGLRCRTVKAFDIDIDDAAQAAAVHDHIVAWISHVSGKSPAARYRTNSPRSLVLVRCEDEMPKRVIDTGGGHQVEFLADRQFFVFAGTHKSGERYRWRDAEGEWPELSREQLTALLEELQARFGTGIARPERPIAIAYDDLRDLRPTTPIEDLARVVTQIPNHDFPYDLWLKVGMAIHYESGGSEDGFDLWTSWSELSDKHNPSHMPVRWASFRHDHDRPATLGTLIDLARRYNPIVAAAPSKEKGPWLQAAAELMRQVTPPSWVIKGLFEEGTLGMIFGPSGCGKSFLTLDIALHIASGREDWHGHPVRRHGTVAYLAGEGHGGIKRRLAAWGQHHGVSGDAMKLFVSSSGLDLNTPQGLAYAYEAVRSLPERPVLIVVDTLHRFLRGDENRADDAREMIDACGKLQQEFGCAVMLVHHTGNNAEAQHRARGSSAWKGALDWEFGVAEAGDQRLKVKNSKMKDSAATEELHFIRQDVGIAGLTDEDGKPIGSAVIERVSAPVEKSAEDKRYEKHLRWLREAFCCAGSFTGGIHTITRVEMLGYLTEYQGMAPRTAQNELKPSKKNGFVADLISRRILRSTRGGWAVADPAVAASLFVTSEDEGGKQVNASTP